MKINGYKDSVLGEIPVDWEVVQLGEYSSLMTNGFVGSATPHYTEDLDGVTYIQGYNVQAGKFRMNGIKKVNRQFHNKQSKSILEEGDILTVQTGHIGTAVVVTKELEGSNCHALIITRLEKGIFQSGFVCYFINSAIGKAQCKRIEVGTTMKHINVSDFLNYVVPLPPLPEQQKIASILSTADQKIEVIDQQISETQELKKGLMQKLLTKGIGHTKFKDSALGEIPESWEVVKLGDIGEFKNGINKDKKDFGHGFPLVNLNNVFGVNTVKTNGLGLVNSNAIERKEYNLLKGDILFIRSSVKPSGVGLTALVENEIVDAVYSGFIIRFRDGEYLNKEFKKHCFHESGFRKRLLAKSTVSANTNINQKALNTLILAVPPLPEQQKIASILSTVDDKLEVLQDKKAEYQELKKGLMQQLLTGKTRVKLN